jgi:hypothetical protein
MTNTITVTVAPGGSAAISPHPSGLAQLGPLTLREDDTLQVSREKAPCCMGRRHGRTGPYPRSGTRDARVLRPSELEHVVQHLGGDGHLGRFPPICLRA